MCSRIGMLIMIVVGLFIGPSANAASKEYPITLNDTNVVGPLVQLMAAELSQARFRAEPGSHPLPGAQKLWDKQNQELRTELRLRIDKHFGIGTLQKGDALKLVLPQLGNQEVDCYLYYPIMRVGIIISNTN